MEKDEHSNEPVKVVDRRKFNKDGSRRGDASESIEEGPAPPPEAEEAPPPPSSPGANASPPPDEDASSEERPTPLLSLLFSLATSVQMALGDVENPAAGGQRYVNLEEAQGYIDILADIQKKTKGRLTPGEERFLTTALYEVQMRFVARQQELLTRRPPKK